MMNKLLPYILLILVLCSPTNVTGQHKKPAVIAQIERAFEGQQSEWKVVRRHVSKDVLKGAPEDSFFTNYRIEVELKSAELSVLVSVTYWDSSQNTRDVFKGHAIAFDNITGSYMTKTGLPDLGDESYMWTAKDGSGNTTIHLRKGHIQAIITAPSVESAKRFARLVADPAPPPNNGMHPTRDTHHLMYNHGAGGRVMRALDR